MMSSSSILKANYKSLQPFLLDNIMDTGEEIGKGAYGTVFKIRRWGTVCAAKKLHDFPLGLHSGAGSSNSSSTGNGKVKYGSKEPLVGSKGQLSKKLSGSSSGSASPSGNMMAKFERECHLLSNLRHPYIVQFLGVYIEKASGAPVIVMEYLPTSLASCVESKPTIPRHLQISMLLNVALGLAYLHGHNPPIIHRDLTANNVLLTSNMIAKIADLGVARILDLTPRHSMQLTQAPGTAAYMPPEALSSNPAYNTKMDSFSFGILILHLISQQWPIPTEAVKVLPGGKLNPISEIDRRTQQIDLMGRDHCLYTLTSQCLLNDAKQRPEAAKIALTLEALQGKFPMPSTSYLDLLQVLESNRNQLEARGVQLAANKEQIQTISLHLEDKDKVIHELKNHIMGLEKQLAGSLKSVLVQDPTTQPGAQKSGSASGVSPPLLQPSKSSFTWKRDSDLPVGMFGGKAIIVEGKIYIGGGDTKDPSSDRVVHEYEIDGIVRKWTSLPTAPVLFFALANVNNKLTLIGGLDFAKKAATNELNVWDREEQRWNSSVFPPMLTSRQDCSVTSYKSWLLAAGGSNFKKPIYNVELFDCSSHQWHTIRPLPKPSVGMTSCVIKNTWYLLGGTNFTEPARGESGPKEYVFSLHLDENVTSNKWRVLPETPHYCSTAVQFGNNLMALGGTDSLGSRSYSPSMFLYSPSLEKWTYIGNMPTARSQMACLVLPKGRLIVLGGQERLSRHSRTVEILYC